MKHSLWKLMCLYAFFNWLVVEFCLFFIADTSIVDKQIRNLSDLMLKYVVMEREADTCLGRMEQVMHSVIFVHMDYLKTLVQ